MIEYYLKNLLILLKVFLSFSVKYVKFMTKGLVEGFEMIRFAKKKGSRKKLCHPPTQTYWADNK